jgi:ABC-2 type transport system ATP-binding protein
MHESLIKLDAVTKLYRQFRALDNASFDIRRGDIFGYIGPNGSGKTTTIKIMVGLIRDFSGKLFFDGNEISGDWGALHSRLGYLPQGAAFQEWRTVEQALRTFGRLSGIPEAELDGRIGRTLELLGISDTRGRKISKLSGGTIQKVGMAQAILHAPELLVLDEPMTGLDPKSRYEFKNIFKELNRAGTTIFFSSHILSDVQDLASKIGILSGGRITHIGTAGELEGKLKLPKKINVVLSGDSGKWKGALSIPGVKEVAEVSPGNIVLRLDEGADVDAVVDRAIGILMSTGCKIREIRPETPTLEELYIRYLGGAEEQ